jgi:hypothetical protein
VRVVLGSGLTAEASSDGFYIDLITRRLYILQFKSSITDSSLSILHSYSSGKIIPIIPPTFMIQIKAGGPNTIGRLLSTVIITVTKLSSIKYPRIQIYLIAMPKTSAGFMELHVFL